MLFRSIVGFSLVFRLLLLGVFLGYCVGRTSHPSLGFFSLSFVSFFSPIFVLLLI